MATIFYILNTHFDSLIAAMLIIVFGFVALNTAVRTNMFTSLDSGRILSRLLAYCFVMLFTLLFCVTYVLSKTDPDFSVGERYRKAFQSIQSFVFPVDPLLIRGGLEKALVLNTEFVNSSERVFFTVENEIYSVRLDGSHRKLLFAADGEILQAGFSPDGRHISMKTPYQIAVYSLKQGTGKMVYQYPADEISEQRKVRIAAAQWSPDSKKLCFFVEKISSVSSQTQWYVYDLDSSQEARAINLATYRSAFLYWAKDSGRLYFHQVFSREKGFLVKWFEIPLDTLQPQLAENIFYDKTEIPDEMLAEHRIHLFEEDKRLRFENPVPFIREGHFFSPSGRRLWINRNLQLCYQSAYGVRFVLFGLSQLSDYLSFPPKGRDNEVAIQDIRWMTSDKYVLLKHYTYGLLVLYPIKRQIGVLVSNKVGIYGVYPD